MMLPIVDIRLGNTLEVVYGKNTCSCAVKDFLKDITDPSISSAVRDYALQLYSSKMPSKHNYFFDKTPQYYFA